MIVMYYPALKEAVIFLVMCIYCLFYTYAIVCMKYSSQSVSCSLVTVNGAKIVILMTDVTGSCHYHHFLFHYCVVL